MRRSILAAAIGAPLILSLALLGCGKPKDDEDAGATDKSTSGPKTGAVTEEKKPLEGKPGTVLKGKVTLKGSAPDLAALTSTLQNSIKTKPDQMTACFEMAPDAEKSQQYWVVDAATKGVGNVVVWIQPPGGYYFKIDPTKDKTWDDPVELKQPHCMFIPHVSWVVPAVVDPANPKKTVPTGQRFTVSNTADVAHNTKWDSGGGPNTGELGIIKAHSDAQDVKLSGNNQLVHFVCNIHPWMDAYVWVFNHPYAAVTSVDPKTGPIGSYEIKNVPAGSKVMITAWHEKGPNNGFLTPAKIKGDEIELKDGENTKDFELEVK
jgi:hypothetical protein